MTVSPRWPHDGTPTREGVSDPVAANASDGTNPPPTLLRLPNLNAAPAGPPAQEIAAQEMTPQNRPAHDPSPWNPLTPNPLTPNPLTPNALTPNALTQNPTQQGFAGGQPQPVQPTVARQPVSGQATPVAAWAPATGPQPVSPLASAPGQATGVHSGIAGTPTQVDRQIETQQVTDQPFSGRTFPNLSDRDGDAPAGRSWMEIAQQHGVVVLMLLIVVAAAVFTGSDSGVDDPDVAIVDAVDLFGVEDGIAADMPMPNHTHDAAAGVSSSPQAALLPDSSDIAFTEQLLGAGTNAANHGTSVASLEPPRTAAEDPSVAAHGQGQPPIVENQFAQQLNAKPVANRFGASMESNSDITFNAPSLEELADSLPEDEATVASQPPTIPAFGQSFGARKPVPSKTPVGISDWTQYLPQLPTATSK